MNKSVFSLTTLQANGAMILRSDRDQDSKVDAREMLAAVRKVYPTAVFQLPFRTFDGDPITQFSVRPASILECLPHYKHGEKVTFA